MGLHRPPPERHKPTPQSTHSRYWHSHAAARLIDNHCSSSLVPLIGFPSFGENTAERLGTEAREGHMWLPVRVRPPPPRRLETQARHPLGAGGRRCAINTHGVQAQPLAKLTATQLPLLSNFFLEINEKYIRYKQYLV